MKRLSNEELAQLYRLALSEPQDALLLLREYEAKYIDDPNLLINRGGILVDIGYDLQAPVLVEEGLDALHKVVDSHPDLAYNLANGYAALAKIQARRSEPDFEFDPDDTPWNDAKKWYRQALAVDVRDDAQRALQWTNYGNCLSALGRDVEAISAYSQALRIVRDHPMAKGNLGVELLHFAQISREGVLVLDAKRMLDEALASSALDTCGGPRARAAFEQSRKRANEMIARFQIKSDLDGASEPSCNSVPQESYVRFCAMHGLFLNLCLDCRRCQAYRRDSLGFSLITDIDDKTSYTRLSRVINEVKERHAFGRLLLYHAIDPPYDTLAFDELTSYVDNLDHAVYGARVASLKQAFECGYNILDKIAHFLNDYLRLGITSSYGVSFATRGLVWRRKKKTTLRRELRRLRNRHLYALYDLARDLDTDPTYRQNDGYWGHLRRTRNALTHEYLVLHVERVSWKTDADDSEVHMDYADFLGEVTELYQVVRAAVIYLIAFVDTEERKKTHSESGLRLPMSVPIYDAALYDSALDLIGHGRVR